MKDTKDSDLDKLLNNGLNVVGRGYNGMSIILNYPYYKIQGNRYVFHISKHDYNTDSKLLDMWRVYYESERFFGSFLVSDEIVENESDNLFFIENAIEGHIFRINKQHNKNRQMKNKVIDIIAKELYDSEEACGYVNAVSTENEYKDVAERIANKLIIPFKEPSNTQWTGGVVLSTRDSPLVDCSFLIDGKIIDLQIDLRDVRNPKARNLRLDN